MLVFPKFTSKLQQLHDFYLGALCLYLPLTMCDVLSLSHSDPCLPLPLSPLSTAPGAEQGTVEGLAFEPRHGDVYWTCSSRHSINRINVREPGGRHQLLVPLGEDDKPRGIAIDSCNRCVEHTERFAECIHRWMMDGWMDGWMDIMNMAIIE